MSALHHALQTMHEQLWDDEQGMVRLYGLHLVRETALGAFLDLELGNVARAERALHAVLQHQYPLNADARWAGTFKTHAAQAAAGTVDSDGRTRDQEWRDFDPNWRQFLGVILWITERLYGHVLDDDLRTEMNVAATLAARSEPVERIVPRYTNIALMQAWLAERCSVQSELGSAVGEQIAADGDISEYNSPTYDAISLFAGCLLTDFSTTDSLRGLGSQVVECITSRLTKIWHPSFALQAGPYSRAYGIDPRTYVSLMAVLMAAIDVPAAGPTHLDDRTTHVHDLYFLPIFTRMCGGLRGRLNPTQVDQPRRHVQRFGGTLATSILEPHLMVGFEHGRRNRFALDQYAPFTLYSGDRHLGVRTRPDTAWVDVREVGRHVYEISTARRTGPHVHHDTAALTITASHPPIMNDNELLFGDVTLQFPGITVEVRLARP